VTATALTSLHRESRDVTLAASEKREKKREKKIDLALEKAVLQQRSFARCAGLCRRSNGSDDLDLTRGQPR